ncbi:hypothetical protein [Dactylosporangium sp. NPDC005555]|uniref:hypothetical protein n=1 Tax=Dactylosporangium sp. NPDC005555 TaxID=3154889 RepID=UPI0033B048DA
MSPRWQEADAAVESLVGALLAEAARTAGRGTRVRPGGRKSTRHHIAEVIRAHELAPGLRVDRNMVAALFIGHRDLVSNPVLVVAVARACSLIAGRKLTAKKVARLRTASLRVAKLIARADADTYRVPAPRPAPLPEPLPEPLADPVLDEPVPVGPKRSAAPTRRDAARVADRQRRRRQRQQLRSRRRARRRAIKVLLLIAVLLVVTGLLTLGR